MFCPNCKHEVPLRRITDECIRRARELRADKLSIREIGIRLRQEGHWASFSSIATKLREGAEFAAHEGEK